MKILMLIKSLGMGGAERHVVDLSLELKQRGHQLVVAFTTPKVPTVTDELLDAGVPVLRIPDQRRPLNFLFGLAQLLQAEKPEIVHVHSPVLKFATRILRFFFGFRLVTTYHNLYGRHHYLVRCIDSLSYALDNARISCSDEVAESMPWTTIVVQNGINIARGGDTSSLELRDRFGIPSENVVFVCTANLLEKKNHAMLIDAFAREYKYQNAQLVLFGEGDQRQALEKQVEDCGVTDVVHMPGATPDAASLLSGADIFCLVSRFEGLPLSLLEAMFAGLPCIVTRTGGMATAVEDHRSGFVIDVEDIDGLVVAMRTLSESVVLRRRMGDVGRQRVMDMYGLPRMVDEIEAVYKSIK